MNPTLFDLAPFTQTETHTPADIGGNGLPSGWAKSTLDNLTNDISYGYTASSTEQEIGPKMLRITDIQDNNVNWDSVPFCEILENQKEKYLLQDGDLVFARTGATVGKSFLIQGLIPESVYASYLIRVRCLNNKIINYLSHYFKSPYYWQQITEFSSGIGQPNVNGTKLKQLTIPLPPLAEQHQIAARLDTLLAQVDSLKARLDGIPALLKTFRQSVLAAAVSGKLTEGWRDDNQNLDAVKDLMNIFESRTKIFKKAPEKHLINEEYAIPVSWQWTSLDSLASKIVDGTHHTPTYIDEGMPFISVKDINNGTIDFSNTKFISIEEHSELVKRCSPEYGDLLITKSGTIGRTAIIDTKTEFSLFVSVALIKPASQNVNMKFIDIALQKWVNEIDVSSRIVGSAIKNLHLRDMKVLAIPFPPLPEQTEIVSRVETLFAFADTVEARVQAAQAQVNQLTQSILAKAFRGELTADWRAQNPELISGDNSAAALLERIQAERQAQATSKSAGKTKKSKQT